MDHLTFQQEIIQGLIGQHREGQTRPGRRCLLQSTRLTARHFIEWIPNKRRMRCAVCSCKENRFSGTRIRTWCPDCGVGLCGYPSTRLTRLSKESPSTTEISPTLTSSPQTSIEKCVFCGNKGIYFCYDCKSAFCKPCRDTHDKPLPSKKHIVTDLKSVNPSAVKLMCELHKSEYTFYCIPCNTLVCNICITSDHKEHGMSGILEKSDEIKRLAHTKLSDMKDQLQRISKLAEKTKMVHIPKLDEESGIAIARIGSIGKELQKLIETKIDMKVDEVQDATHWKKEELQSVLKNKERIYRKQTAVYESLETLLSEEHAVSFLVSYQTLKRDMCDLTGEAKDDIEPHPIKIPDLKGFLDETISSLQEYRQRLDSYLILKIKHLEKLNTNAYY
ncbi:Hypothetical predicted protein [Mytilus galloprovincialis]|uniref:B box-type domain-containing protein n=1 Tax=Mytilus galloprovincialis TaxID=29158 RepID=A0A8B6DFU1_MYTGA|nr:Hypothetical predicted protein [Mytilus galloprovincialis]